jgi:hypothetical protein
MRTLNAGIVALMVAACTDVAPRSDSELAGGPAEGYTLEVRADAGEQIYLVTSPEGRTVAARVADGVSTLMETSAVRALAATPTDETSMEEVVSLRMPGVDLSVSGDPNQKGEEGGGRVSINVGGHSIEVNASEGGPGQTDDNAHVLIRGVPESEARAFIVKADQVSPAVQAEMLAALGLD